MEVYVGSLSDPKDLPGPGHHFSHLGFHPSNLLPFLFRPWDPRREGSRSEVFPAGRYIRVRVESRTAPKALESRTAPKALEAKGRQEVFKWGRRREVENTHVAVSGGWEMFQDV